MEQKHRHKDLDLTKLKQDISSLKQELLRTRGACEAAQQSHSTLVFQVQKGDEEIRTLNDTLNAMERRIQSNNIEVESLDDTISFLKRDISEKKRQIVVCQKQLTCKKSLEEEINLLQTQLLECKDQNLALEKSLENPDFESRIRKLQGSDPSPEELISKIQQLEVKLGEKEQQLHEKELVYEQEDRLCNALQAKVDRSRQDTLEQAMKANKMKASIKKCTKKVKAVAAELAMVKANAMALQQERQEEELRLDVCRQRLEQGLPPSEDMEQEWLRYLRDEHRRHADQQLRAKMSEDEERQELPSGTITTAEPRPNAYIPLDDPLPLPKPYGALAPYKPSQPGTSMRHIRKPKPRPIEI
uniref:Uncharacterized protein n=2 Tax=Denticeps clupeoides TaxID=299321 RepID=A0AAY4EI72_9TELE